MSPSSAAATQPESRALRWDRLPVWLRRALVAVALIALWQVYAVHKGPLLMATPWEAVRELWNGWTNGSLAQSTWTTLRLLLEGVGIGVLIGAALAAFATVSKLGEDVLALLTSVLSPLPGVAVLPLAMLLFGLNETAIRFVIANATIWPIAIAINTGFKTASPTLVAVGRNIGLSRFRLITDVLTPSALPVAIVGLKSAWAFGWRTIIAAELVFGVAGSTGGLGNYINNAREFFLTPKLYAGLLTIAILGVLFELLFALVERRTVVRWGMKAA
jgi:NitT/TauT family transport system permease protein